MAFTSLLLAVSTHSYVVHYEDVLRRVAMKDIQGDKGSPNIQSLNLVYANIKTVMAYYIHICV